MTINKVTLGLNQGSTSYGPFSYGSHAGEPVVDVAVSESESNQMQVRSIKNIFETYNWRRKINSGFARMQFHGKNVILDQHSEGIQRFSDLLDARFVDFEIREKELNHAEPSHSVKREADYYRVFVPEERNFDPEVFQFYVDQANSFGNVDFLFKIDAHNDDEYVNSIINEYRIYDSDVWLFPKGRKVSTISERMQTATDFGKRHSWNVSPRLGIMAQAQEELADNE